MLQTSSCSNITIHIFLYYQPIENNSPSNYINMQIHQSQYSYNYDPEQQKINMINQLYSHPFLSKTNITPQDHQSINNCPLNILSHNPNLIPCFNSLINIGKSASPVQFLCSHTVWLIVVVNGTQSVVGNLTCISSMEA